MSNTNKTYEYLDYGGLQTYHTELMKYIDEKFRDNGVRFLGTTSQLPWEGIQNSLVGTSMNGSSTYTYKEGDIIIVTGGGNEQGLEGPSKEYVLAYGNIWDDTLNDGEGATINGYKWIELGDITPSQNMINESLKNYYTKDVIDTGLHKMRFMGVYDSLPSLSPVMDEYYSPMDVDIKQLGTWYPKEPEGNEVYVVLHEGDIIIVGGYSNNGLVGEDVVQMNSKTYMLVCTGKGYEAIWDWVLLAGGGDSPSIDSPSIPILPSNIDADTLDGKHADEFAPTSHASAATTYGVATTSNYGHVKILNGDISTKTHQNGVAAGLGHTHSQFDDMVCFNNNIHLCNNQDFEGGAIYFGDNPHDGDPYAYIKEEPDDSLEVYSNKQLRLIGAYNNASIVIGKEDDMGDYVSRISINAPDGLYINGKKYNQSGSSTDSSLNQKIQNLVDEIQRLRTRVSYLEDQIGPCDGDCPGYGCDEDWCPGDVCGGDDCGDCPEELELCYPDEDEDGLQDDLEDGCVGDWDENGCDDMDDDGVQDSF